MATEVALLGASGYTGRLVAYELEGRGIGFVACGRDPKRVEQALDEQSISARIEAVDATDPSSIRALIERTGPRLVITTIGPFLDMGKHVASIAARSNAHYLDSCGEQVFIKWMLENESFAGLDRTMVPSLAFEYALADAGAEMLKEELGEPLEIRSFYYIPSFSPSRGTRASMLRAMQEKTYVHRDGRLIEADRKTAQVAIPEADKTLDALLFPAGEPVMIPRHVEVNLVESYMVMSMSAARMLYRAAKEAKDKKGAMRTDELGPSAEERKKNRLFVIIEGKSGAGEARLTINGIDAYGLTAHLLAEGASAILSGRALKGGACTPVEAFGADRLKAWCEAWGLSFALET